MPGKRVQFDDETFEAITAVACDTGKSFQKIAEDAARDHEAQPIREPAHLVLMLNE